MTVTTKKLTLEEYFSYEDGTDTRYELVDGELVAMSLGTARHGLIVNFLTDQFKSAIAQTRQPWLAIHSVLGVQSPSRRAWQTSRIPDISIVPLAQMEAMDNREAVITINETPPLLVVEVVSPSTKSDDYRSKRGEYGFLNIPEYWIVDPLEEKITLCSVDNLLYDSFEIRGSDRIQSPTFPDFDLTVAQILAGKR